MQYMLLIYSSEKQMQARSESELEATM